jgi:hypothetical protein
VDQYKKINTLLLASSVLVLVGAELVWNLYCTTAEVCSYEFRNTYLRPIIHGGYGLIAIFATLLVFPGNLFKRWLQFIFSWGFPVSLGLISAINVNSSNILSPSKAKMAELLSWFFFILTVIFISAYYLTLWWKKRK